MVRRLTSASAALAAALATGGLLAACGLTSGDDNLGACGSYQCGGGSSSSGAPETDASGPIGNTPEARQSYAKQLFVDLYPDFAKSDVCGRCHAAGLFDGAPLFLAGASAEDAYATISDRNKWPNIIVADFANSILLTKGQHAGEALLEAYPELAERIVTWLRWEAAALEAIKPPSTVPVTLTPGLNSIPLDALGGPGGVSLRFEVNQVSNFLRISNAAIAVAGTSAVRVVAPRLFAVTPDGTDLLDPSDSFGGVDVECPMAQNTPLAPSTAIFSGAGWTPWDPANKLRVEVGAITPITIQDGGGGLMECKNVGRFTEVVLPVLTGRGVGQGVNGGSCRAANCHGNAQKSPDMSTQYSDAELCMQIRKYIDFDNPAQSRIAERPTSGGHAGGAPSNRQGFIDFWVGVVEDGEIF